MEKARIDHLMQRYIAGNAGPKELQELYEMLKSKEQDDLINDALMENWLQYSTTEKIPEEEADQLFRNVIGTAEGLHAPERKLVHMRRWISIAAAVCLSACLLVAAWLLFNKPDEKNGKEQSVVSVQDIASPDKDRAVITLSNGRKLYLDSFPAGSTLAIAEHERITRSADGQIIYQDFHTGNDGVVPFNTLVNPRGSRIAAVTLPDGTKVWLNAATTIRYFARVGKERKVEIDGEAYFEVAHMKIPFIVTGRGTEIHDLGTSFNVNAYADEPNMKVTLLEGAVQLKKGNEKMDMRPGQQVMVNEKFRLSDRVNLDAVMAWKNGRFWFGEKADIKTIMRQISRWYDVEVEYRGNVGGNFGGSISRNVNLVQVLKILESTGEIHYKMENNTIIIMP